MPGGKLLLAIDHASQRQQPSEEFVPKARDIRRAPATLHRCVSACQPALVAAGTTTSTLGRLWTSHGHIQCASVPIPWIDPDGVRTIDWQRLCRKVEARALFIEEVSCEPSGLSHVTVTMLIVFPVIRTVACCPWLPTKVSVPFWPGVVIVTVMADPPMLTVPAGATSTRQPFVNDERMEWIVSA